MPNYGGDANNWKNPPPGEIKKLLSSAHTVAVVGLSSDPSRPSYGVAKYLQDKGFRIFPVNPNEKSVLGERSYPDIKSIPGTIDIVDVFRNPAAAPAIVDEALELKIKAVWLQESVVSIDAFRKGKEAGLIMIMDRCIFKEHSRLLG